jgi:hypothetical protein
MNKNISSMKKIEQVQQIKVTDDRSILRNKKRVNTLVQN